MSEDDTHDQQDSMNTLPPSRALQDGRERCGAKPRPNGQRTEPCAKWPTPGSKRCHIHGSKSRGVKERVEREKLEDDVRRLLARRGHQPVTDPLTELGKLAGEVLAWKDAMADRVQALTNYRYSTEQGEAIRGEVILLERALDRCASVLGLIAKLNIDDRLVKITERQAEMLETALFAAFEAAGLPVNEPDKRDHVAREFNRHLAVVEG